MNSPVHRSSEEEDGQQSSKIGVSKLDRKKNIPYNGWELYFSDEAYKGNSATVQKVKAVEEFISRHSYLLSQNNLEGFGPFNISINLLDEDEIFIRDWSGFAIELEENPSFVLNCIGLAVHQTIINIRQPDSICTSDVERNRRLIRIQILNHSPIISLRDIKNNKYGKLVSTRGCVIRVGQLKYLMQWIEFVCQKCKQSQYVRQVQGVYTAPAKCASCKIGRLRKCLSSKNNVDLPFQIIRVQEHSGDEQDSRGSVQRILEVELLDDLADTCLPGDDITLTGIIKKRGIDDITAKGKNTETRVSLYMEAVCVINNKSEFQSKSDTGGTLHVNQQNPGPLTLSPADYTAIQDIHENPNKFELLIHSLCPGIYGHEMVKAGLILSLFGGNGWCENLRNDVHVLIVGDPGLGKSQMLQACARVANKGVYISGTSSTSSGLTVTLTKEGTTNDYGLEPGALVLADNGCCCIDEFDKLSTQYQVLLEAMEQQSVSIAKSGVLCSLRTRTSILAAANPLMGTYDRSKTREKNLKISSPVLSRFDLIFLLLDEPNAHRNSMLCDHVTSLRSGIGRRIAKATTVEDIKPEKDITHLSLREKLINYARSGIDPIPATLLQKYITYARQYVKPKLSDAASKIIQEFYLDLRAKSNGIGGIPIYHRQLEATIRLTQARAKVELREEATETDALQVIEILQNSILSDYFEDSKSREKFSSNSTKVTAKKVRQFKNLLQSACEGNSHQLFSMKDLKDIAENGGVVIQEFSNFISKLNEEGILLKKGTDSFRFFPE